MGALTKADMAEQLVQELNFNKKDAKAYVEALFSEITRGILDEGEVKLSGFGNFRVRHKPDRPGRNPKTGDYVKIAARSVVTFRPGQKLKTSVESAEGLSHLDE